MLDVFERLVRHPNIAGIKDSVSDFRLHQQFITDYQSQDFAVFTSAGRLLFPNLALGGAGGVFHEASVAPKLYQDIVDAWDAGDIEKCRRLQRCASDVGRLMAERDPASAKYLLSEIGLCSPLMAAPLAQLNLHDSERMRGVLDILKSASEAEGSRYV